MLKLLILHEGRFGTAVADRLARRFAGAEVETLIGAVDDLETRLERFEAVALALWRRYPGASDRIDEILARRGMPSSSATLEGPILVCGPVISPGRGPCHRCYLRRRMTQLEAPEREQVLSDAYDADPSFGVAGFAPGMVTTAAAALALDLDEHVKAAGRVRFIDVTRGWVEESHVVRVHGCERCGRADAAGMRYVDRMVPALEGRLEP